MLDVIVNGPGFGESIILRWQHGGEIRGALVDCYAPHSGRVINDWLDELEIGRLEFVVASHPHLDHIYNTHYILRHFDGRIGRLCWWGGLSHGSYVAYYKRMASLGVSHLITQTAEQVQSLFDEYREQWNRHRTTAIDDGLGIRPIYPTALQPEDFLDVESLSPWEEPLRVFSHMVSQGLFSEPIIPCDYSKANLISLGLMVRYGDAALVLGADVTEPNWQDYRDAVRDAGGIPTPCLIKVSHHGSQTGRIDGIWAENGFLGFGTCPESGPKVAVITPWHGKLPEVAVIDEIRRAGYIVYVTGQSSGSKRGKKPCRSYVHSRIDLQGSVTVVATSTNVACYSP